MKQLTRLKQEILYCLSHLPIRAFHYFLAAYMLFSTFAFTWILFNPDDFSNPSLHPREIQLLNNIHAGQIKANLNKSPLDSAQKPTTNQK